MTIISEKTKTSMTIKEFISLIIAVVGFTWGVSMWFVSKDNNFNAFKSEVKSELQQVKATQRVFDINQRNQYTVLSNKIDVESGDRKAGQEELKTGQEDLKIQAKETQHLIIRVLSKGTLTDNQ